VALTRLAEADPATLPKFDPLAAQASDLAERSFGGLGAVGLAGLADGVNPCALAGLAFLLSYLLHRRGSRRGVLLLGALFCAGTFVAYFAAGLGLYFVIASSRGLPALRLLVYAGSACACLVFAAVAWWRMLPGANLSHAVSDEARRTEHALVRSVQGSVGIWFAAPFIGAAFACLELACTGQLYLPALAILSSSGSVRDALSGLVLYNLAFLVAPLALTVTVAWGGVALTAPRFARWAQVGQRGVGIALLVMAVYLLGEVRRAAGGI
jgi:cytochrome c biogenesis protein CcdA